MTKKVTAQRIICFKALSTLRPTARLRPVG